MEITTKSVMDEAVVVAQRLGVWVLHDIKNAENVDYLIGYFIYRVEDIRRRQVRAKRSGDAERARFLADRAAYWSRGCRMIQRLRNGDYKRIATSVIENIEVRPEFANLPYVANTEVETNGLEPEGRRGKLAEKPPKRAGRPRTRRLKARNFRVCTDCKGIGIIEKGRPR